MLHEIREALRLRRTSDIGLGGESLRSPIGVAEAMSDIDIAFIANDAGSLPREKDSTHRAPTGAETSLFDVMGEGLPNGPAVSAFVIEHRHHSPPASRVRFAILSINCQSGLGRATGCGP